MNGIPKMINWKQRLEKSSLLEINGRESLSSNMLSLNLKLNLVEAEKDDESW